jgi:hypothetical protein
LRLGCTEKEIRVCVLVAHFRGWVVVKKNLGSVGWLLFIEAELY